MKYNPDSTLTLEEDKYTLSIKLTVVSYDSILDKAFQIYYEIPLDEVTLLGLGVALTKMVIELGSHILKEYKTKKG